MTDKHASLVGITGGENTQAQGSELSDQLGRTQRTVALMIFLRWWDEDPECMTNERVAEMIAKFDRDFMPSLNEPHCGDCTKVCAPCVRCHTEELLETARRIAAVIEGAV